MEASFKTKKNTKTFMDDQEPITALYEAVPAVPDNDYHIFTIHTHKILIQKQTRFYKTLAMFEGVFFMAASLLMITLSAATVVYAHTMLYS